MKLCSVPGCESKSRTLGLCNKHALRLKLTGTTDPGARAHASLEERFWRRVQKAGPNECWEWTGGKAPNGYGIISKGGKSAGAMSAHRASYMIANGAPAPSDLVVMHSCDNRGCVNPNHLRLGTVRDNTADMDAKGRRRTVAPLGEGNGKSVLNADLVRYIRSSSKTQQELAF